MSSLTKIFVVLLVVLSILSSAAFVTYVNAVGNAQKAAEASNARAADLQRQVGDLQSSLEAAKTSASESFKTAAAQIEQMKQARDSANQLVADRDAKLGEASAKLALQSADVSRLTEALKAGEDSKGKLQDMVTSLRGSNDNLVKQNADQSITISEITNKLEVTERERRFLAEQLAEAQNQTAKLTRAVKDMGGDVAAIMGSQATGLAAGAPKINGVVKDSRNIAGIPYATISVGSSDGVIRGMSFKIVDRDTGKFLGMLVVDTVEPTEATGRLQGPAIAEIRPGVEVKTQL